MQRFKKWFKHNFGYITERFKDFGTVVRPLWVILLFQVLVAFAFVGAPQGQDMLLTYIIDFKQEWRSLGWFWLALLCLSAASEFGSRLIIYFSDLTTHELEVRRVRFRKLFQKHLSKVFLFAPVFFVTCGFILAYRRLSKGDSIDAFEYKDPLLSFIIILLFLAILVYLLYLVYFGKLKKTLYQLPFSRLQKYVFTKLYSITKERWITRVQEIDGVKKQVLVKVGGIDFIKPLMKRFYIVFLMPAAFFILFFSFLPVKGYDLVGASALICMSFACWIIVYCSLNILDKVQPLRFKMPYRLSLIVIVLLFSWFNNDHPARIAAMKTTKTDERKLIHEYFDEWVEARQLDTTKNFPVIFIGAEGGALRTGCFTSMMLARLQDSLPNFKNYVFCYSGVSGGSLGVNFFNALTQAPSLPANYQTVTRNFYNKDFLSATTGKLIFAEILNAFIPRLVPVFDRAQALERTWENSFEEATGLKDDANLLATNFSTHAGNPQQKTNSVVLINITEVESGSRTIWSNVQIDPVNFKKVIDLQKKSLVQLPYSTAISLSARFPLVSPAGAIEWKKDKRLHYVDGGYYENKGALGIAEALEAIKKYSKFKNKAEFFVLQFHFSEESEGEYSGIQFLNDPREILGAITNVRSGHTNYSYEELFRTCKEYNGVLIPLHLPLDGHKVPMNWVLSSAALTRLEHVCNGMLRKEMNLRPLLDRLHELPK
ncbi:MAG: hypothetical protein ABL872_05500 [Lacibacter sp.]